MYVHKLDREQFIKFLQSGSNPGDPGVKLLPESRVIYENAGRIKYESILIQVLADVPELS